MMERPDLATLDGLPSDGDGPVFAAPWQAQAFAMVSKLLQDEVITWQDWTEHLAAAIARARDAGDPDLGDTYYLHWLAALESLAVDKGLATADDLHARRQRIQHEHLSSG